MKRQKKSERNKKGERRVSSKPHSLAVFCSYSFFFVPLPPSERLEQLTLPQSSPSCFDFFYERRLGTSQPGVESRLFHLFTVELALKGVLALASAVKGL